MSAGWIAVRAIVFSYGNGSGKVSSWMERSFHVVPRLVKNRGALAEFLTTRPNFSETWTPPRRTGSRGILSSGASQPGFARRGGQLEEL